MAGSADVVMDAYDAPCDNRPSIVLMRIAIVYEMISISLKLLPA